jgi:hypothetical protein
MEQSSEPKPRYAIDFTGMRPEDVVQVCQTIDSLPSEQHKLEGEMQDAFYHGLDYLSQERPDLAQAAYQALATSEYPRPRLVAAISIYMYAGYDKYRAFPIWNRLLHDRNHSVQSSATEAIMHGTNEGTINPTEAYLLARRALNNRRVGSKCGAELGGSVRAGCGAC